jgi:hypothetical protein
MLGLWMVPIDTLEGLLPQAWVIFTPTGQLVSSGGSYLWEATNNVVEYSAII